MSGIRSTMRRTYGPPAGVATPPKGVAATAGDRVAAMRITVTAVAIVLLAALAAAASAQDAAPASYVALGDSYASGEGAAPDTYLPGTAFPDPATGGPQLHRVPPLVDVVGVQGADPARRAGADVRRLLRGHRRGPDGARRPVRRPRRGGAAADRRGHVARRRSRRCRSGATTPGSTGCCGRASTAPRTPGNAGCGRPRSPARRIAEAGLRGLDATLAGAYVTVASRMAPGGRLLVVGYPRPFADGGRGYRPDASVGGGARLPPRGHAAADADPRDAGRRAVPERRRPTT